MNEKIRKRWKRNSMKSNQQRSAREAGPVMLAFAASAPTLLLRLFISYLKAKRRANAASKEFLRALIAGGIPKDEARSLADTYSSSVSIRKMMRDFGMPAITGRLTKRS
jgi:hypothetical protein